MSVQQGQSRRELSYPPLSGYRLEAKLQAAKLTRSLLFARLSFTQGLILGQLSVVLLLAAFIKFFIFGDPPNPELSASLQTQKRLLMCKRSGSSFGGLLGGRQLGVRGVAEYKELDESR